MKCCFTLLYFLSTLTFSSIAFAQEELVQPDEVTAIGGVVSDTLTMEISPITIGTETIMSRLYNGKCPGPTWRLHPGELLRVYLRNQLPPNPDQDSADQGNFPQRINTTNLHVHGLNVSPKDSSDNVLLSILPGTNFQFHVQLPNDHAAGTYWYHPHHHTSTMAQVVSGLAGTIIVEDVNDPLVTDPALLAIDDRIFIFSAFQYDTVQKILPYPYRLTAATAFVPIGGIETPVFVNGMMQAKVTFRPNEIQRWRFINATYELNMDLRWLRINDGDTTPVVQQHIAIDGLYFAEAKPATQVSVTTGGRADVLVKAPAESGRYILQQITRDRGMRIIDTRDLIEMRVAGDPIEPPMIMPSRLPLPIVDGTIADSEITGTRDIVFAIGSFANLAQDSSIITRSFTIDNSPFDHDVVNQTIQAGDVEEWTIHNVSSSPHPFHIHVNEFQVTEKNGVKYDPPVWHDVLLLDTMSTYKIRHRFLKFDGKTVMHCHYLPHEDWGMMNLIDILPLTSSVDERPWEVPLAFPNPVVGRIDRVSVRIPELLRGRSVAVVLHDVTGQVLSSNVYDASTTRLASLDVSSFPAGTYYVRVDDGGVYRESDMIVIVR